MTAETAAETVAGRLRGEVRVDSSYGQDTVDVPRAEWVAAHESARDLGFTFFDWLTGVDQLDAADEPGFDVVSHLWSMTAREHLFLRTRVSGDDARLATLTGVFSGASWHERETFEMFGLDFGRGGPPVRSTTRPPMRVDEHYFNLIILINSSPDHPSCPR